MELEARPVTGGCGGACACHSTSNETSGALRWVEYAPAGCAFLALVAWLGGYLGLSPVSIHALYAIAIGAGGWPLLAGAWQALLSRSLDMNVLMSVAVIGAAWLGDWAEAASLVVLYAISNWVEERSVSRSRHSIEALMQLAPQRVLVKRDSPPVTHEVDAETVALGEIFLVRAGERVALDGVVAAGRSQVNQAPVTGESTPVEKAIGDEVFAGTLNSSGVLEVRATRSAHDGTMAHIARLVAAAHSQKSPRQRTVERFARVYTPVVMAVAILVAVLPPLVLGTAWSVSVYRALALLVAACPCGFVLSGPVASWCALSQAARNGILIRGSGALETLAGYTPSPLTRPGR